MAQDGSTTLVRLGDTDLTVQVEDDIRGLHVLDRDGDDIGEVDELLVDEQETKVRFIEVGSGGFLGIGTEKRLIPVDAITQVGDDVRVDTTKRAVAASPAYDPEVVRQSGLDYYGGLYGYYGYGPFWGPGYM